MENGFNIGAYSDALVVLAVAGLVVPMLRRLGVSPILGYLAAGAALGPLGLGSFMDRLPALYWFSIVDAESVSRFAELGVVFLLFLIGLELSLQRLITMRRLVFGLGSLQVLTGAVVIGGLMAGGSGRDPATAIILGASLSLSSTAIVLEVLAHQGRLTTTVGRAAFSVLLAQDLAVIPILLFVSILGGGTHGSLAESLATALLTAVATLGIIAVLGRIFLRPVFRFAAATKSNDLFIAATLFVIVAAGVAARQAGLSMALGAFVAGLLLAETEYGKAIQATIEPFKSLLLGIFFFSVGMSIDVREVIHHPLWLAAVVVAIIVVKAALVFGLGRLFGLPRSAAVELGLLLGPGGEFAFVTIGAATAAGLVEGALARTTLVAASLTMALLPLLAIAGRKLAPLLDRKGTPEPELVIAPEHLSGHAIVVGYGRVGKVTAALLSEHGVPFVAVDFDAASVTRDRRGGHRVYFGDAADPMFLKACGLEEARAVVITIESAAAIDRVVNQVRDLRPDVKIITRARDSDHARHLYAIGATDAVPETVEASLQLSEASLVALGVPMGPVIASIHQKRDDFRAELQKASLEAGRGDSHAIRPKGMRDRLPKHDQEQEQEP
ncbi:cation:proton antiporter [Dongia sp.]|uniref:cation:proton antiporter domain-containing protein n=1 Tax=Dongia sp. TaxID=1977262 RepID=UPI003752315F